MGLTFLLAACSGGGSSPGVVEPPIAQLEVQNLGYAILDGLPEDDFVAFQAIESSPGSGDLNGDGDVDDVVLMVHRYGTGSEAVLGAAVEHYAVAADAVAFVLLEAEVGSDLNADGDLVDGIVHVHRVSTATTLNLALATSKELPATPLDVLPAYYFAFGGDTLAFVVSEEGSGAIDFNRDGDVSDVVFGFHDVASGQTTVSDLAATQHREFLAPATMVGAVLEEGSDLNGDGDTAGLVLTRFDLVPGGARVEHLSLDLLSSLRPFDAGEDFLLANVSEVDAGDLNGDGDATDRLFFAYDLVSGTLVNTGETFLFDEKRTDGRFGAFLNSAGELFIYDADAERVFDTGVRQPTLVASVEGFLHYVLREDEQASDLNGDGDLDDLVSFLYEYERAQAFNLGVFALSVRAAGPDALFVGALEINEGDLNGDGDVADTVLLRFDRASGGLAVFGGTGVHLATFDERFLVVADFESPMNDLNGDGDRNDLVLQLHDADGAATRNLALAGGLLEGSGRAYRGAVPFFVFEDAQGGQDLNADGDAADRVLFLLRP